MDGTWSAATAFFDPVQLSWTQTMQRRHIKHDLCLEAVFIGENKWRAIRISGGMREKIKYIAAYRTAPDSAITHIAPIDHIESYGDNGKYQLVFSEPAKPIGPIPFGNAPSGSMQGPRYTTRSKLLSAKTVSDVLMKE
jgi:hypothetical protein